ncbi:hypothetical protein KC353_g3323 [Hortaea werneckii]|uniref:Uncharacterized protein n=1 Tax=Hortaea werneckii TaxID=91943 RepID=A0A3M7CY99_HORWE|nr:hypothetical protein KC353_g3323 [Hortaea werneckii]RMY57085.1 hypothetical protein D0865_03308 [Hortaea werneckii]
MSTNSSSTPSTFPTLLTHLLTTYSAPVLPSPSPYPHNSSLNHPITTLSLHPTLEALLHILNSDLASAHFLVRKMQAPPAYEGMMIHAVLHRVEGDYRNAEAWYGDVFHGEEQERGGKGCLERCWGSGREGLERCLGFVRRVEGLRKKNVAVGKGDECGGEGSSVGGGYEEQTRLEDLERESRREIEALVAWCAERFGTGKCEDATQVWVRDREEVREMKKEMVVGGEGWRQF